MLFSCVIAMFRECTDIVLRWEKKRRRSPAGLSRLPRFQSHWGPEVVCSSMWQKSSPVLISRREERQLSMRNPIKPVLWLRLSSQLEGGLNLRWLWWCGLNVSSLFTVSLRVFSSVSFLTAGFCNQWEFKGSFSRVSDLTQLTRKKNSVNNKSLSDC